MNVQDRIIPTSLHDRLIIKTDSWHEFLQKWNKETNRSSLQALLLEGFDVSYERMAYAEPQYAFSDRIAFYCSVADGWIGRSLFVKPLIGDSNQYRAPELDSRWQTDARKSVAEMAFKQLCQHVFKDLAEKPMYDHHHRLNKGWAEHMLIEESLQTVMAFFKPYRHSYHQVSVANLHDSDEKPHPLEKYAKDFLLKLQEFLWAWEEESVGKFTSNPDEAKERNRFMRALIDTAKPWMIEVLAGIGELDRLWELCGPRKHEFIELDPTCLARLKEIALSCSINAFVNPALNERRVVSVEEAFMIGSTAAQFLVTYDVKKAAWERLAAIRQAEWDRKDAENKLAALSQK